MSAAPFAGREAGVLDADWLTCLLASREVAACVLAIDETPPGDYCFVAVSRAFAEVTGLRDAVGHSMRELRPEHEQHWFDLYARVAQTGEPARFEQTARALERRFRGHAFRIGAPEHRQVVTIFENCSTAMGHDPEGADAEDGVLQKFGATLAHELRAPLAPLVNGLHILKQLADGNDAMQWPLTMMERQFTRLSGLVDDMLDVGRLGTAKVRIEHDHVNLHHVVSESIEACAASIDSRHHEVTIDSDGAELLVKGDRRRLQQVFTNLLTNSIKYTEPGGRIRIALRRADNMAIIDVSDNGSGISSGDMPYIFNLFNQGEVHRYERDGGLGIGLSIVHSVVRLHGGTVSAHSDGAGRGSVFTVRLPLRV